MMKPSRCWKDWTMAGKGTSMDGQARRRLRTRQALVNAARELLVEGRGTASIEEITKRAGVGFGSFFNHFPAGKDALFDEALFEVLDGYAAWQRAMAQDLTDPAERFARSFRLTGRMAAAQPDLFAPVLTRGSELLLLERGLRQEALADLRAGVDSGRFDDLPPEVHLMSVGGVLIGLVRVLSLPSAVLDVATVVDRVTEGVLRLLGVPARDAADLVTRPLPALPEEPIAPWAG
jgi:AcrR family transcriptional regulator